MTPPVLHLTNLSSTRQHGPGRLYAAMARPGVHVSHGKCPGGAPPLDLFDAVRLGRLEVEDYLSRCEVVFRHRALLGELRPERLSARPSSPVVVREGDTLFCRCPRPDSPRRRHRCHLEVLAPALVLAGWSVVLYGQPYASPPQVPAPLQGLLWGDS